jgi:hypothetical protein
MLLLRNGRCCVGFHTFLRGFFPSVHPCPVLSCSKTGQPLYRQGVVLICNREVIYCPRAGWAIGHLLA